LIPFAIIGSVDFVTKEDGRRVRARHYPWGIVEGINLIRTVYKNVCVIVILSDC